MSRNLGWLAGLSALLPCSALLACSDGPPSLPAEGSLEIGRLQQPIIGGLPAAHPALDPTGALVYRVRSSGAIGPLCTASLIGPQTLVTAKHCISVLPTFERIGIDVLWARGPDFNHPVDLNPVVSVVAAPGTENGLSGYGRDVGVAHLDRAVLDLVPLTVQPFTAELLGASMVTLGYGVSSANGQIDGLRRIGRETVMAVEGNGYEILFGDFESFLEYVTLGSISDLDVLPLVEADPTLADLPAREQEYAGSQLLPGGEIITGKAPGDTQSCDVDSGGPLARVTADGRWETYAVVSSSLRFDRPLCAFGQVFATFGPTTFELLESERGWADPCGDLGVEGECIDGLRRRCETSFARSVRRVIEEDCRGGLGEVP